MMATYLAGVSILLKCIVGVLIFFGAPFILGGLITGLLLLAVWFFEYVFDFRWKGECVTDMERVWMILVFSLTVFFLPLGYFVVESVFFRPDPPTVVEDRREVREYKMISHTNPKHVYVTIEDSITGQTYERQYVAKHCQIGIEDGETFNTTVSIRHKSDTPNNQFLVFLELADTVCD